MNRLITFLVFLVIISCKNDHYNESINDKESIIIYHEFPKETFISSDTSLNIKGYEKSIRKFFINDSLLIINNTPHSTELISIYDRNSLSLIKEFSTIGRGPDQIGIASKADYNNEDNIVSITDYSKHKVFLFNLTKEINNVDYKIASFDLQSPSGYAIVRNGYAYYNGSQKNNAKNILIKQDLTTGKITPLAYHYLFSQEDVVQGKDYAGLRGNYIYYDNKILYSYLLFNGFVFFNLVNDNVIHAKSENQLPRHKGNKVNPDDYYNELFGYRDPYITNNYIFISYYGVPLFNKNNKNKKNYPKEIHVFDHDCRPYLKITLDRNFDDFVIDEKNDNILLTDPSIPSTIFVYKLKL